MLVSDAAEILVLARINARNAVTFARWSETEAFNPVRVDGRTFRNVSAWRAHQAATQAGDCLRAAAGLDVTKR